MASWCKLKTGAWGVKGPGLKPGQGITVTNAKGNSKSVTVGNIVWSGDGIIIATIAEDGKPLPGVTTGAPATVAPRDKPYHGRPGWERSYRSSDGECEDCVFNMDAGDMRGCDKHRGNPRC
jgi:hypothetical protein